MKKRPKLAQVPAMAALAALSCWALSPARGVDRLASSLGEAAQLEVASPIAAISPRELEQRPQPPAPRVDDPWLESVVASMRARFPVILRDVPGHRLQILVTRFAGGQRLEHGYRVDAEYFYPASAIKTFVAIAAIDHLEALAADTEAAIDLDTPLVICARNETRCTLGQDPTNRRGGKITLGHEIRKMQLVSSNLAYNRLFDFVGHEALNRRMRSMGFSSLRLEHRIGGGASGARTSPPIDILSDPPLRIPKRVSELAIEPLASTSAQLGLAHYDESGALVEEPADFRYKNHASLRDLHRVLLALVGAPEADPLPIEEANRARLVAAMEEDPAESDNPPFRGARFAETRFKVMLRGVMRVLARRDFRYVSKGGRAYGFEIENAYVEALGGRAFAVTAVMYANPNGVINDDGYDYARSSAFFEALGAELARRILLPDAPSEQQPGQSPGEKRAGREPAARDSL